MRGFTLLEILVVLIIVVVLTALALPYYRNAIESTRMTEIVVLWGRQKNWISGRDLSAQQVQRATENLQRPKLKYFTGEVLCREKSDPNELCWEVRFTQQDENNSVRYELFTDKNFTRLMCAGLNNAGNNFCETQAHDETPQTIDGKKSYWIR